jgi:hypothetical protein
MNEIYEYLNSMLTAATQAKHIKLITMNIKQFPVLDKVSDIKPRGKMNIKHRIARETPEVKMSAHITIKTALITTTL